MLKGNRLSSLVRKLVLGAAVYHIWRETNVHIHMGEIKRIVEVFEEIILNVRTKLISTMELGTHRAIELVDF